MLIKLQVDHFTPLTQEYAIYIVIILYVKALHKKNIVYNKNV